MRKWLRSIAACVFALALGAASAAHAQERFGSITGTVNDSPRAAVPGATVTAVNSATGATRVVA